ncbi:MAG: hypothetical protein NT062_17015 [Proteobacteria bacterium]|nr:hypothetical protein [Pseudomonadota bacterium]
MSGCDLVLGVDAHPIDGTLRPDVNLDPAVDCTSLSIPPLPTTMRPALPGTFGPGTIVSAPSAVSVVTRPLVMFTFDAGDGALRLTWATTVASTLTQQGDVSISGGAERGTLWHDPNGSLHLAYEQSGRIYITTPVDDGLDGAWHVGAPLELPIANAHLRSVGYGGRRVVVEVDTPHELKEFVRDPATDQLVELPGTMQAIATGEPMHPTMSSDGCRVLFDAATPRQLFYAEREANGMFGTSIAITTDAQPATWPVLSEDATTIYFARQMTSPAFELYSIVSTPP